MGASKDKSFEENIAQLERDGFLLIKNVPSTWKPFRNGGTVCMGATSGENTTAKTVLAMCHIISYWTRSRK